MNAADLIQSYADDVARRLPRKQRNDVGFELRSILTDELAAAAEMAGRAPDEDLALTVLRKFGRPEDTAGRYRPPSFTIIDPAQTRTFVTLAWSGVALQWLLTLPPVFMQTETFAGQSFARLGGWWVSYGLAAFWWPGFLVSWAVFAAWARHRWPQTSPWKPRALDPDRVSRPALTTGLAFWILGASALIALPWFIEQLKPYPVHDALVMDPGFLRHRAPWLLPFWTAEVAVYAWVIVEGRWRTLTRRLSLTWGLAICGLMAWFILGGPIFQAAPADKTCKFFLGLTLVFSLIMVAAQAYREQSRVRSPKDVTWAAKA